MAPDTNILAQYPEYMRRSMTEPSSRDASPVEICELTQDGLVRRAVVSASGGQVVVMEGDEEFVRKLLASEPISLIRDQKQVFIDGRIDGAGWVEGLPEAMRRSSYIKALPLSR